MSLAFSLLTRLLRRHPFLSFLALLLLSPPLLRLLRSLAPFLISAFLLLFLSFLALRRYFHSPSSPSSVPRFAPAEPPPRRKTWMSWMKGLDDSARAWMEEKLMAEGIPLSADANKETLMALLRASFGDQLLPSPNLPQKTPSTPPPRAASPHQSRRSSLSADKKQQQQQLSPSSVSAVSCRTRAAASSAGSPVTAQREPESVANEGDVVLSRGFSAPPAVLSPVTAQREPESVANEGDVVLSRGFSAPPAAIAAKAPASNGKEAGEGNVKRVTFAADAQKENDQETRSVVSEGKDTSASAKARNHWTDYSAKQTDSGDRSKERNVQTTSSGEEEMEAGKRMESSERGLPLSLPSVAGDEDEDGGWRNPFDDDDADDDDDDEDHASSSSSSSAAVADKVVIPPSSTPLRFSSLLPKPSSSPANKLLEASRRIFQKEVDRSKASSTPAPSAAARLKAPSSKRIIEACRRFSTSAREQGKDAAREEAAEGQGQGGSYKEAESGARRSSPVKTTMAKRPAAAAAAAAAEAQEQQAWRRKEKADGNASAAERKGGCATEIQEESAPTKNARDTQTAADNGLLSFKKQPKATMAAASATSSTTHPARTAKRDSSNSSSNTVSSRSPFFSAFK